MLQEALTGFTPAALADAQTFHMCARIKLHAGLFFLTFTSFYFLLFTQAQCSSQVLSDHSGETLPDNFIGFDSVPDRVADGSVVRVRYHCSGHCQLAVEVVVSTLQRTDLVVFRRKWISNRTRVYRIRQVLLRPPASLSHQLDFFNRNVLDAQNVTVRAWLHALKNGSELGTHRSSVLRIYKVLPIIPLSERPSKPPTGCPSWSAQLMWQMTGHRIHQCPHESGLTRNHIVIFSACLIFISKALKENTIAIGAFCCFACTQT